MEPLDQRRGRLDRERILDAAQEIAEREGVANLTMRRIGAELGADPTAVYRHFRNKHELLVQLADRLFGIGPELPEGLDWRETLRIDLRYGLNRYRSHPDLAMLLAVQPDDTPSLQRIAEGTLALLREAGLTTEQAAEMAQVIENHVVGTGLYYSLIENSQDPRLRDPEAMRRVYALLPEDEYPRVVEASPYLFPGLDAIFDRATDLLIEAIERLARAGDDPGPTTPDDGEAP